MGECLLRSHVAQGLASPPAKRATGCREHQPSNLARVPRAKRLSDRRVLGVDGHKLPRASEAGDKLTADNEALLVRERERLARLERGQRRCKADRPGDAVEHDIGLDIPCQLSSFLGSDARVLNAELCRLGGQKLSVRARAETDHSEAIGIVAHHLERLNPDRPRRAEDHDAAHAATRRWSAWCRECRSQRRSCPLHRFRHRGCLPTARSRAPEESRRSPASRRPGLRAPGRTRQQRHRW